MRCGKNQRIGTVSSSGLTLIELMLAIALSSIVLLSVGTVLVSDARTAAYNQRNIDLSRAGSLAMHAISQLLKAANSDLGEIAFSDHCLYFNATRSSYVKWHDDKNQLILMPGNVVLVDSLWEIRDFLAVRDTTSGTWFVSLEIRDPESSNRIVLQGNFLPRNKKPPES